MLGGGGIKKKNPVSYKHLLMSNFLLQIQCGGNRIAAWVIFTTNTLGHSHITDKS